MAEPIKMPLGLMAPVGPRNHVLDGGTDAPIDRGNFEGEERPFTMGHSFPFKIAPVYGGICTPI